MVEHDVEYYFEPGTVQCVDHRLELSDLSPGPASAGCGRIGLVRSEKTDGVVAPIIREPPVEEELLRNVVMDREELDCSDPEVDQVRDGCIMGQAGVSTTQILRDPGVAHGEPLDMHLVNDSVCERVARAADRCSS